MILKSKIAFKKAISLYRTFFKGIIGYQGILNIEFDFGEYILIKPGETMKIKEYPQYKLYKFTKLLNHNKEKFQKPYTGKRAVNGTIINRAYYCSYSYALLWLEEHRFKPKKKWEYEMEGEDFKTEHRQVRDLLKMFNKENASDDLFELHKLRKKADYKLYNPLTEEDTKNAMKHMENIFDELKFKK